MLQARGLGLLGKIGTTGLDRLAVTRRACGRDVLRLAVPRLDRYLNKTPFGR